VSATTVQYAAVWGQPKSSFAKWKARGINCLIAAEPENNSAGQPTVPQPVWRAAARAAGLVYIDRPIPDAMGGPEADANDANLDGFLMDDEPDRRIMLPAINAAKKVADPAQKAAIMKPANDYLAAYLALAARCRATGKPVLGNFSGPDITGAFGAYQGDGQKPFLPGLTELGGDWYPKNKDATRYANTLIGDMLDLLVKWNQAIGQPNKSLWVFLECSNQRINLANGRAPTEAEMDEQLAIVLARNVKGICWFPQSFGPFSYDGMTTATAIKVAGINNKILSPTPDPQIAALGAKIDALQDNLAATNRGLETAAASAANANAILAKIRDALLP
jgi:hypothetical protein